MSLAEAQSSGALLAIEDLRLSVGSDDERRRVVDGVSFDIRPGETVGLVGESGSGKSLTALAIMRLLPEPPIQVDGGRILFEDRDLLSLVPREMRALRGDRIAMIFQEPMTSLNPVFTVGHQIREVLRIHRHLRGDSASREAADLLDKVGIGAARSRLDQFPHELSGGQRQRVMIAIALACRPALLIADEPTTALDVTIQAQILDLLARLRRELGMALLLITHDLGVVAETCDRVAVMYAGRIVESASVTTLFDRPSHPYTVGLMRSIPNLEGPRGDLPVMPGGVPSSDAWRACAFAPRCPNADERCRAEPPVLAPRGPDHRLACWHPVP